MKRILALFLFAPMALAQAPVTVTLTNTVLHVNAQRTSIDIGALFDFGNGAVEYKDPFYPDGGTFAGYSVNTTWKCQGTGMTTTLFPTGNPQPSGGYGAGFFVPGSSYDVWQLVGSNYVKTASGTITANTAANSSVGPTFTLSSATPTACVSNQDVLIERSAGSQTPLQLFSRTGVGISGSGCPGGTALTFDTTDLDPNSNGIQTLVMPSNCTVAFNADQTMGNRTNPNSTIAAGQMNNLAINQAYKEFFGYKCGAASGSGSISVSVSRSGGNTFVAPHTLTPACTSTAGAVWAVDSQNAVNTTETIPPLGNLIFSVTCTTGPCKVSYVQFPEQTTIGNNTVYSDKYFKELQKLHLQYARLMTPAFWCLPLTDAMSVGGSHSFPEGTQRWCNVSNYLPYNMDATQSYPDTLELANELGIGAVLSTSYMNTPAQYGAFATALAANSGYAGIKAAGHTVQIEFGNEAFNSLAGGYLGEGAGTAYGAVAEGLLRGFQAGTNYDSAHMLSIFDGWFTTGQLQRFGWTNNVCSAIAASGSSYPNYINFAPYNFEDLATFTTSGANLGNSGEPSAGMAAQIPNFDSVASPPSGTPSMLVANNYLVNNCGPPGTVQAAVYEHGSGQVISVSTTQLQVDQGAAGNFQGVLQDEHDNLMQRDSGVTGYLGLFALTDSVFNGNNCSGTCSSPVSPVWDVEGPGMVAERPSYLYVQMRNTALATLSTANLVSCPQAGTSTYNYPGGQAGTIGANAAVPHLNATCFTDSANHWVIAVDNVDPTNAYPITFAGITPVGPIIKYSLGGANGLWDQNEGSYLGPSSISPLMTGFTTCTVDLVSCLQTASAHSANYFLLSTSGTPQTATPVFSPVPGTYTSAQTVTVTDSTAGSSIFCTTNGTTPTPSSTPYSGPFNVPTTQTIQCIATAVGFTNSPVGGGLYTIAIPTPTAATPTFTPGAGTYSSAQTVTIASTTPGAVITWGTVPTPATPYSGPVAVNTNETLYAFATAPGFLQSATGSAAYVISTPTAATPVLSPAPPFNSPSGFTATLTCSTPSNTLYYTTDGSTPTTASNVYTVGLSITAGVTVIKAICTASGFANSAVANAAGAAYTVKAATVIINKNVVNSTIFND